ncbi:hypothetical protein D3C72_275740 [compost metagenome]
MANRICLGNRNGTYGAFVSQPGHDVMTAADGNLMLDSRARSMWVVTRGSVNAPASTTSLTVNFASVGAPPILQINRQAFYPMFNAYLSTATIGQWTVSATPTSFTLNRNNDVGDSIFSYIVYGVPV